MKNLIVLLVLLIAGVAYGQPKTQAELDRDFEQRNPYTLLSMEFVNKDTLTADSFMYFTRTIDVYTLLPDSAIFLMVSATDDSAEAAFMQDVKNPDNFSRVKTAKESERLYALRIPYPVLSSNSTIKDMLLGSELIYHARRIVVHLPRYNQSMFLVLTSKNGLRDYIYVQEKNDPVVFSQMQMPISRYPYKVTTFELFSEGPGQESYRIVCNTADTYFSYEYDIPTHVLKPVGN